MHVFTHVLDIGLHVSSVTGSNVYRHAEYLYSKCLKALTYTNKLGEQKHQPDNEEAAL